MHELKPYMKKSTADSGALIIEFSNSSIPN